MQIPKEVYIMVCGEVAPCEMLLEHAHLDREAPFSFLRSAFKPLGGQIRII